MRSAKSLVAGMVGALVFAAGPVSAATLIVVDENGNGSIGGVPVVGVLLPDPGPGGLTSVLKYSLPFFGVQGDVHLMEGGAFLDVIRFNGDKTLVFYSDNLGGVDALADTPSPPGAAYTNVVSIEETGTEANNGALYTPLAGQPGFAGGDTSVTYQFISDAAAVPEPATLTLLGVAFAAVGFARRRRLI